MEISKKFKTTNNLKKLRNNLELQSTEAVKFYLDFVQSYIVEKMSEPKTGRDYGIVNGQRYIASAPGEYPGIKNHELVDDIQFKTARGSNGTVTVFEIGTNVIHGAYLEGKDPDHGGRPWLARALEDNEDILKKKLKKITEQ